MKTQKITRHSSTSMSKNLVSLVLMSIVTAATVFGFTSCSNYMDEEYDYQQWKQALDKAVVLKRIGYTWDTQKIWRIFYTDFEMTEEKFHGVSMFIPQNAEKGKYAKYNEDIKQMEWYEYVH